VYLIEIFLPLADNEGNAFGPGQFEQVRERLTQQYGGVTSFGRAPAHGTFADKGVLVHDDIIVYEVMTEAIDRDWWGRYRRELEEMFQQDEIVVRLTQIERL
jgi:hypothetical protein